MTTITHALAFQSEQHFRGKLPLHHVGVLLAELPSFVSAAVSMGFRNYSSVRGRRPAWLERASDVRLVDVTGNGTSYLLFEAPTLGEAAVDVYAQKPLFPELDSRPSPDDTAFDLMGDVLKDVEGHDADSAHYDYSLLERLLHFRRFFKRGPFQGVELTSRRYPTSAPARVTPNLMKAAEHLLGETPLPQRVRIVGQLDGLVASTQQFSLLIDSGERVVGVFPEPQADAMKDLWGRRVLVLGTATYRASGRLLRIDAETVQPGENESSIFSRMPPTPGTKIDVTKLRKHQGAKSGVNAIVGQWPGAESDDEIVAQLERVS